MRESIATKYHGPTNTRGSRISATSASGRRVFVGCDDGCDMDTNHKRAAAALAAKLDLHGTWAAGESDTGCVFVLLDGDQFFIKQGAAVDYGWSKKEDIDTQDQRDIKAYGNRIGAITLT